VRDDRLVQGAECRLLVLRRLRQNCFDLNLIRIHPPKVQENLHRSHSPKPHRNQHFDNTIKVIPIRTKANGTDRFRYFRITRVLLLCKDGSSRQIQKKSPVTRLQQGVA
jgi:hypothetical protein